MSEHSCVTVRQLLGLYEAYTVDEYCRYVLPVVVGKLATDQVAAVRQAAVQVVSCFV